jgi:hypothetical protein
MGQPAWTGLGPAQVKGRACVICAQPVEAMGQSATTSGGDGGSLLNGITGVCLRGCLREPGGRPRRTARNDPGAKRR